MDLPVGYNLVAIARIFIGLVLFAFSCSNAFAYTCEGPCSNSYWSVAATSPATGSTYTQGDQVVFTTEFTKKLTGNVCTIVPSIDPSSGWGISLTSPSSPYSFSSASSTDVVVTVDIGVGNVTVTIALDCDFAYDDISVTFTITGEASGGVRITGLADMSGTWSGTGDAVNNDDVCIYSSAGTYDILVEGPTDSGDYVLENGLNKLPITVYWNNTTGTTGRTALNSASNPSLSGVTGADTSSETCSGSSTANISWKALEADLLAVPAGTYTATISTTASVP